MGGGFTHHSPQGSPGPFLLCNFPSVRSLSRSTDRRHSLPVLSAPSVCLAWMDGMGPPPQRSSDQGIRFECSSQFCVYIVWGEKFGLKLIVFKILRLMNCKPSYQDFLILCIQVAMLINHSFFLVTSAKHRCSGFVQVVKKNQDFFGRFYARNFPLGYALKNRRPSF